MICTALLKKMTLIMYLSPYVCRSCFYRITDKMLIEIFQISKLQVVYRLRKLFYIFFSISNVVWSINICLKIIPRPSELRFCLCLWNQNPTQNLPDKQASDGFIRNLSQCYISVIFINKSNAFLHIVK